MTNQTNVDGASIQSIVHASIREKPILFSASMVRAILSGRKTQTRRVIKPQPETMEGDSGIQFDYPHWHTTLGAKRFANEHCKFGRVGERLWVRETCWSDGCDVYYPADAGHKAFGASDEFFERLLKLHHYSGSFSQKVPSIHMPRWASRITLEIESVRVERLNAISEADAMAEGVERIEYGPKEIHGMPVHPHTSYYWEAFKELWESINGPGSWAANPWVWVVQFRRV